MSSQPQLTVSGYRGIWGDTLTTDIARTYTNAFANFVKEKNLSPIILLGRDGRESGEEIIEAIIETLNTLGINYINGDILPTPTVLFAVRKYKYDGAIIVTASHNPIEYNGLKFVTDKALFTDENEVAKIKKYYEKEISNIKQKEIIHADKNNMSSEFPVPNFPREHADHILKNIDVVSIQSQKFKVAVDMINASACVVDPYLFSQLNIELVPLNNIPNGKFTHKPEPLKENLSEIAQLVKSSGSDVGF
ncbi:hypothetical protein K8Q96_02155, partial [Candidatus Nomurabacteria bacterium]|nr:hypothetical protein [Candidatus Nomurabacteria bacterium]